MVDNPCSSSSGSVENSEFSSSGALRHATATASSSTKSFESVNECHPTTSDIQIISEMFPGMDSQKISDTLVASGAGRYIEHSFCDNFDFLECL